MKAQGERGGGGASLRCSHTVDLVMPRCDQETVPLDHLRPGRGSPGGLRGKPNDQEGSSTT